MKRFPTVIFAAIFLALMACTNPIVDPAPSPSATASPSASPEASPSASPSPTPSASPSPEPSPSPSAPADPVTPVVIKHPTKIVVSASRGFYLQQAPAASGSSSRVPSIISRDVISATASTLMQITQTLTPAQVEFQDENGVTVQVTVNRAVQLDANRMLIDYVVAGETTVNTAFINLSSGGLTALTVTPANWERLHSGYSGLTFTAGGKVYSAPFNSGVAAVRSASATTWNNDGYMAGPQTGTAAWSDSTIIAEDAVGTLFLIDAQSSQAVKAIAVKADGSVTDFGSNLLVFNWATMDPASTFVSNYRFTYDEISNKFYEIAAKDVWDNDPSLPGGSASTGFCLKVFPITLDPSASGVASVSYLPTTWSTATQYLINGNPTLRMTHLGLSNNFSDSMWTNGHDFFKLSSVGGTPVIAHWYCAGNPVSTVRNGYNAGTGAACNFAYSGGIVYAGPVAGVSNTIDELILNANGSVTDSVLVTGSGTITAWSVVGGVLFWTDSAGTWKATVNTAAGTLGAISAYTGVVQAVTN